MINTNVMPAFSNNLNFPNILTKIISNESNDNSTYEYLTNNNKEKHLEGTDKVYENYKNSLNHSKVHQKLAKIKIFFIAKSIEIEGQRTTVAIPINTLDDLSNSGYAKALTSRVGLFQMRANPDLKDVNFSEGTPGNQPFLLGHTVECNGSFDGISNISLEDLKISRELKVNNMSEEEKQVLQDSKLKVQTQFIVDQNGIGRTISYYVYQDQYEYDYIFLDNSIFTNVELYCTDPRDRDHFKKTFLDKLKNLKELNFVNFWDKEKKALIILESTDVFYKNTDELLNKNIIPIFSNFEDAQNLLITVLEEILEPYKKYDFLKKNELISLLDIDYIDDSFNFKNRAVSYTTIINQLKDWLVKYRIMKSTITPQQHYQNYPNQNNIYYPQDKVNNNNRFSKENSYLYNELYINDFDEVLFSMLNNTKIVSMELGDFFYFWNNKDTKNGEVLFIPSSKELRKTQFVFSPSIKKESKDQFYEYQKQFRNKTTNDIPSYLYELKNSSI